VLSLISSGLGVLLLGGVLLGGGPGDSDSSVDLSEVSLITSKSL